MKEDILRNIMFFVFGILIFSLLMILYSSFTIAFSEKKLSRDNSICITELDVDCQCMKRSIDSYDAIRRFTFFTKYQGVSAIYKKMYEEACQR